MASRWGLVGTGLFAGALSGVAVLGILGRAVMRIVALRVGAEPGFSVGGTLEVLATGLLLGAASGPLYALSRRFLPGPADLRGLAFGGALFSLLLLFPPPAARSAVRGLEELLPFLVMMFGILFLVYGVALERLLSFKLPGKRSGDGGGVPELPSTRPARHSPSESPEG